MALMFQSRNRETSIFNTGSNQTGMLAVTGFNLVIERLLFSTDYTDVTTDNTAFVSIS